MEIVFEVVGTPDDKDILIWDKKLKAWKPVKKEVFLDEFTKELQKQKQENEDFKQKVNEKLKEYHNILQIISGGNK